MTHKILIAAELIGSLILVIGYGRYRRGPAAPWANRALLSAGLCGLCYALTGVLRYWSCFGLGKTTIAVFALVGNSIGGIGAGLIICLFISGQIHKIGFRQKNEESK